MNEKELIARLQARDETAFEELIRLYEKKVYALCVRMCGNAEDAEEAAQDAFLALWRGIDRFRQESALYMDLPPDLQRLHRPHAPQAQERRQRLA